MLYQDYNSTIRDIFRQVEGVSQHGLEELYDKDIEEGIRSYSDALIAAGMVSKEDLINLVSQFLGFELQVGEVEEIDAETIQSISSETAHQYAVVPLYLSSGGIHLLASDPFNSGIIDDLTFALNQEIHLVVCDPDEVTRLLEKYYPKQESTLDDIFSGEGLDQFEGLDENQEGDLADAANETPIIRFMNLVLQQAIRA